MDPKKPSSCSGCPLEKEGEGFYPGEGPADAKIVLVTELPKGNEGAKPKRPFISTGGSMLRTMLYQARIDEDTYRTSLVKCNPPAYRTPTKEEISECRRRYLDKELTVLHQRVTVPCGDNPLRTLYPESPAGTSKVRGSVFPWTQGKIIPIVHSSYIAQGNPEFWGITVADLTKAKKEKEDATYRRHPERFNIAPSLRDLKEMRDLLLSDHRPFAFDIETIGIEAERANLLCVGFAWSESDALCVPLLRRRGDPYWRPEEEAEVVEILQELFASSCTKITQNGFCFDLPVLQSYGFKFEKPIEDTLVKHHVVATELPHSLDFLGSIYTPVPYHKGDAKDAGGMLFGADDAIRTYNLRDCIITYMANREIDKEIDELGLRAYYVDVVQDLTYAVLQIQNNGMLIDKGLMQRFHKEADDKQKALKQEIEEALGYPFNPNSPQQVMWMFNRDLGIQLRDSTDRLSLLKTSAKHPEVTPLVQALDACKRLTKARGTYLELETSSDGRVRSTFRVYGTLTWRLSSKEPDLQNLPRETSLPIPIKQIYIAGTGRSLVELDFKNLEFRIPAYASGCTKLITAFERGEDLYCYLASIIFGRPIVGKGAERQTGKTFKLAEGYRAGPLRISDTILLLSGQYVETKQIKEWLAALKKEWPEIYRWQDECIQAALKYGYVEDGFGVRRYLHGRRDDYQQIGVSWPTQATASGIMNRSLVRIYRHFNGDLEHEVKCVCQVHDSLMFEIKDEYLDLIIPTLKSLMETPVHIFGRDVVFPVDVKVGKSWGKMEEYHVRTAA